MTTAPSILLLDDGELDPILAAVRSLGVGFIHLRGAEIQDVVPKPYDVVIASLNRATNPPEFAADGDQTYEPVRICVHKQDFLPLRERLRSLGVNFLVHSLIEPEALRLLIAQLIHQGPEQRGSVRLPFCHELSYRHGDTLRKAMVVDLSTEGCRMLAPCEIEPASILELELPRELSAGRRLDLIGVVSRCSQRENEDPPRFNVVVEFTEIDPDTTQILEATLQGRQLATRITPLTELDASQLAPRNSLPDPPAPAEPPDAPASIEDRRNDARYNYDRPVIALSQDRGRASKLVLGRDLSRTGIRIDPQPGLKLGSELRLAIYGSVEQPLVLRAKVVRSAGKEGLGLQFIDPSDELLAVLDSIMAQLPEMEQLLDEDTHEPLYMSEILLSDVVDDDY